LAEQELVLGLGSVLVLAWVLLWALVLPQLW